MRLLIATLAGSFSLTLTACHADRFDLEEATEIAYCDEICEDLVDEGEHSDQELCLFECLEDGPDSVRPIPAGPIPQEPDAQEPDAQEPDAQEPGAQEPEETPGDLDGDGFSDEEEAERGTDPTAADTDGDGQSDCEEGRCGSSPLDPYLVCEADALEEVRCECGH